MKLFCTLKNIFSVFMFLLFIFLLYWLRNNDGSSEALAASDGYKYTPHAPPIVIWWTNIMQDYHRKVQCGVNMYTCEFMTNRDKLYDQRTKAIAFYGSDINKSDLPLPRTSNHIWALMHEESPKNVPYIQSEAFLKHFNLTSTFSRFSDFPLTMQYLKDVDSLKTRKYLRPIGEKSLLRKKDNLAPVVFVQSICDTMSGRDEYVQELMQYIAIDSYGQCLNNKKLPKSLTTDYLNTIESDEFYHLLARYKFIISYENAVCNDYISEKFWRPLVVGAIPIYFGSPTIQDWAPNNKSVIYISDFASPKALASYLKQLDTNDTAYNEFLDHKYSQLHPITNQLLTNYLTQNDLGSNLFESFECFICESIQNPKLSSVATQNHYDCPKKLVYPPGLKVTKSNEWASSMVIGKCEADILDSLLQRNLNFTDKELSSRLHTALEGGDCDF